MYKIESIYLKLILCTCFFSAISSTSFADPKKLNVIASIKPLQMIVCAISDGVFEPNLLLDATMSPHDFQLKPSQINELNAADLVIWYGPDLEVPMKKLVTDMNPSKVMTVLSIPELKLIEYRTKKDWPMYYETAQSTCKHEHEHEHGHKHEHTHMYDPHIWLSPRNTHIVARNITEILISLDPANTKQYENNLLKFSSKLDQQKVQWKNKLKQISDKNLVVTHDGYQYLEKHFKIKVVGTIILDPELPLSTKHYGETQKLLSSNKVDCVCREPQISNNVIESLINNQPIKTITLDAIGIDIQLNKDSYFELMNNLVDQLVNCK